MISGMKTNPPKSGMSNRFLLILLLFLTACTQVVLTVPETPRANYLYWNADRPLTWEDFQGRPFDATGTIACEIYLLNPSGLGRMTLYHPIEISVYTCMDRSRSWVRAEYKSADLLLYNQLLFDLYEIQTRHLRQEFKSTKFSLFNPLPRYQEISNRGNQVLEDRIVQFRRETNLGRDSAALAEWQKDLRRELAELAPFELKNP